MTTLEELRRRLQNPDLPLVPRRPPLNHQPGDTVFVVATLYPLTIEEEQQSLEDEDYEFVENPYAYLTWHDDMLSFDLYDGNVFVHRSLNFNQRDRIVTMSGDTRERLMIELEGYAYQIPENAFILEIIFNGYDRAPTVVNTEYIN